MGVRQFNRSYEKSCSKKNSYCKEKSSSLARRKWIPACERRGFCVKNLANLMCVCMELVGLSIRLSFGYMSIPAIFPTFSEVRVYLASRFPIHASNSHFHNHAREHSALLLSVAMESHHVAL